MNSMHTSKNPDAGSRWHFLLAVVVAVIVSIGLTSTAAKAGLMPATPSTEQFEATLDVGLLETIATADTQQTAGSYQPAVIATPGLLVSSGGASALSVRPYLEEEEEFKPKFQHVVARGRPGRDNPLTMLGCALAMASNCGQSARL